MELPIAFTNEMSALLGKQEAEQFLNALQEEAPVSVRLNEELRMKNEERGVAEPDSSFFILNSSSPTVPWCPSGRYLESRPSFTFDPLFHAGAYYVQEASSMFVGEVLRQCLGEAPVRMLDLCAAPGGKSTLARSVLPPGSLLVANEVIRTRAQILAENLTKWGHPDVVVCNNDPADFAPLEELFDVILTDVPCSGEGMFRKDAAAADEWSPENVELCSRRQRRILADVWPALKPGGWLIYSTCTYNIREDEENVLWACRELGAEPVSLQVPDAWNITGSLLSDAALPVYRFLPHKTKGEGFFLAVLRKTEASPVSASAGQVRSSARSGKKQSGKAASFPKDLLQRAHTWVCGVDDYEWLTENGVASLFPQAHVELLPLLRRQLRVMQAGVAVGEVKGRDLIPRHALAMSRLLNAEAFPREELSYEQAVAYLRREAIVLDNTHAPGFVLVTYQGRPLGFVKQVGNRANNLYPQEWRIRSEYRGN